MRFLHFLARVSDEHWLSSVGHYYVLLGCGPATGAALRQALVTLHEQPGRPTINVTGPQLTDCSVRLIPARDGLMSKAVKALLKQVDGAVNPRAVPDHVLREVLLLTSEYDELTVARLLVHGETSTLEVAVGRPDLPPGLPFAVSGALAVVDLAEPLRELHN